MMYEQDRDYARGRLVNTYVVYKDKLVFVLDIGGRMGNLTMIYKTDPNSDDIHEGKLKDVDIAPIKLGYSNYREDAKYLMRVPARRWKQGIDDQATRAITSRGGDKRARFGDLSFVFQGTYPNLLKAVKNAVANGRSTAFSRVFAILPDMSLEYKGRDIVGKYENNRLVLDRKYLWLEEALRDNVH